MTKALVLGGGGSKGAYEIGVWKALDELNEHFDLICGTSIGAMNGVLYVQHDYDVAVDLWNRIRVDDIMKNGVNFEANLDMLVQQKDKYGTFLNSFVQHKGADIQPFIDTVTPLFNPDAFFQSEIDYACMMVNVTQRKPWPMTKAQMTKDNVIDYVMASGSCFPAFPMKEINGELFIDGGYHDNVPIQLARDLHATQIVAVDLNADSDHEGQHDEDVIYIKPHVTLGSFLYFENQRIERNMELGYQDTMKKYHQLLGSIYTFALFEKETLMKLNKGLEDTITLLNEYLQQDEKTHTIVEKLVNYRVGKGVAEVQQEDLPYVALLEQVAYLLELSDVGIWRLDEFMRTLLERANAHESMSKLRREGNLSMTEVFLRLSDASELELICFVYQYMKETTLSDQERLNNLKVMSVIMNDSFLKATMLYALDKFQEAASKPIETL